jgi:hypothetical protein
MATTDMTLHVELSGLDRDLLERTCENLEWYRKRLQEMAQAQQVEQEAYNREVRKLAEREARVYKQQSVGE